MSKSQPTRRLLAEQRTHARRQVDLAARARVDCHPWLDCRVRNISPMGALLEFERPTILPRHFRLQIPGDLFETECDLRHQFDCQVGVLFVSNRAAAVAKYS